MNLTPLDDLTHWREPKSFFKKKNHSVLTKSQISFYKTHTSIASEEHPKGCETQCNAQFLKKYTQIIEKRYIAL